MGHVLLCACPPLLLPLTVALFQPLPHLLQIVKKRPLPTQVGNLSLLYYTHPFIGHTVRHIGIVVHAVSHQLALRWQGKVLNEFARRSEPLLQVLMLPDIERARAHRRGHPAIWRVSLINVHKQEISYITEVLHQLPESRQVADEGGSGGWAKVDHQRAIRWLEIQKAALISIPDPGTRRHISHITDTAAPPRAIGHLHQFGVWCLAAQFHLGDVENKDYVYSHNAKRCKAGFSFICWQTLFIFAKPCLSLGFHSNSIKKPLRLKKGRSSVLAVVQQYLFLVLVYDQYCFISQFIFHPIFPVRALFHNTILTYTRCRKTKVGAHLKI